MEKKKLEKATVYMSSNQSSISYYSNEFQIKPKYKL